MLALAQALSGLKPPTYRLLVGQSFSYDIAGLEQA
jgi:hypothetical protein